MATNRTLVTFDVSSAANYKAIASAISAMIVTTAGWTRSYGYSASQASPGTFSSWASLTLTGIPGGFGDTFEVYSMADAKQSTTPFVLRIDYWASGSYFVLQYTIGNDYNNSTGAVKAGTDGVSYSEVDAWTSYTYSYSANGDVVSIVGSGSTSSIRVGLFMESTQAGYFAIERSMDNSGSETTSFMTFIAAGGGGSQQMSIGKALRSRPLTSWMVPYYQDYTTATTIGVNVALFPIIPLFNTAELPLRYTLICKYQDIPGGMITNDSATHYGMTGTYMQIINVYNSATGNGYLTDGIGGGQSAVGILMLWS